MATKVGLFHRHVWKIVDQVDSPVSIEKGDSLEAKGVSPAILQKLIQRDVLVTYRCADCQAEKVERV